MSAIVHVHARELLDSRGKPTIEAEVILSSGVMARAMVPSGASTGKREAVELRDKDPKRYQGMGVLKAVRNVNGPIYNALIDRDVLNQREIDETLIELDGTPNKSRLGANAILGISLACAKAASRHLGIPIYKYLGGHMCFQMPIPMANILNGGSHADSNVDLQEFMVMPTGASDIREGVRWLSDIFHSLKGILKKKGLSVNVGDEGGFAPTLKSNEQALDFILEAVTKAGYKPKKDVYLAIDAAASELVNHSGKKNTYKFWKSSGKTLTSSQMVKYWTDLVKKYPEIISIEDPLGEDDWEGWQSLTKALDKKNVQLVGDDLFVTNTQYLEKGINLEVGNAILVKVNQIGTLSETMDVIKTAHANGYQTIMSHRSGETEDSLIADLSIGFKTGQIKTGSLCRSDRLAKYNQLLRIHEELCQKATYSFHDSFSNLLNKNNTRS